MSNQWLELLFSWWIIADVRKPSRCLVTSSDIICQPWFPLLVVLDAISIISLLPNPVPINTWLIVLMANVKAVFSINDVRWYLFFYEKHSCTGFFLKIYFAAFYMYVKSLEQLVPFLRWHLLPLLERVRLESRNEVDPELLSNTTTGIYKVLQSSPKCLSGLFVCFESGRR